MGHKDDFTDYKSRVSLQRAKPINLKGYLLSSNIEHTLSHHPSQLNRAQIAGAQARCRRMMLIAPSLSSCWWTLDFSKQAKFMDPTILLGRGHLEPWNKRLLSTNQVAFAASSYWDETQFLLPPFTLALLVPVSSRASFPALNSRELIMIPIFRVFLAPISPG